MSRANFRDHRSPWCMLMSQQCDTHGLSGLSSLFNLAVKIQEYLMAPTINSQQSQKLKSFWCSWFWADECNGNLKWIVESFLATPDISFSSYWCLWMNKQVWLQTYICSCKVITMATSFAGIWLCLLVRITFIKRNCEAFCSKFTSFWQIWNVWWTI